MRSRIDLSIIICYFPFMTKNFPTDVILSVTTGIMLSEDGLAPVQGLTTYTTSAPVPTHHIPRAMDECVPEILRQHPPLIHAETIFENSFDGFQYLHLQETFRALKTLFGHTLPISSFAALNDPNIFPDHTTIIGKDDFHWVCITEGCTWPGGTYTAALEHTGHGPDNP